MSPETPRDRPAELVDRPAGDSGLRLEGGPLEPERARLLPFYHDLRNEIVQPDKIVVGTQYFWARWAPRLGPTLTTLIVCLRRHCYYNRITQERRDWCFPEQATLAREIGVETTKTIRAALSHPLAATFVRREPRYVYDPGRGKKIRTSDRYYVAMDDPLTPEDEALLAVRAAERLAREGRLAELTEPTPGLEPTTNITGLAEESPLSRRTVELARGERTRRSPRLRSPAPEGHFDLQARSAPDAPTGQNGFRVPDGELVPQDSTVISGPESVLEDSTNTTKYGFSRVIRAFAAANGAEPTPAQRARLQALAEQFDPFARRSIPPSRGHVWVLQAIEEAVESGSHFVAPRRVARICERWAARALDERAALALSRSEVEGSPMPRVEPVEIDRSIGGPEDPVDPDLAGEIGSRTEGGTSSFIVFPDLGLRSRPLWRAIADDARSRLASAADRQLLDGSQLLGREELVLVVGVPGQAAARRAEIRLTAPLEGIARAILGRPVTLRFVSLRKTAR